jgi:hypothetical protein
MVGFKVAIRWRILVQQIPDNAQPSSREFTPHGTVVKAPFSEYGFHSGIEMAAQQICQCNRRFPFAVQQFESLYIIVGSDPV